MDMLDRAQEIASMRPLPANAEGLIQSLMDKAKGDEKQLIGQLFEAVLVARIMGED